MEISKDLKKLYNHWGTQYKRGEDLDKKINFTNLDKKLVKDISEFIKERMNVWDRKNKNIIPYTKDDILLRYRFCNIYRELDRQTIELHTFLKPLLKDFDLWFLNMLIHRIIARPETSKKLGFITFNKNTNLKILEKFYSLSRPKFGNAYVFPVSVLKSKKIKNREEFLCIFLPENIKSITKYLINLKQSVGINEILDEVCGILGLNLRFHLTEVLIDTAYQFPNIIDLYKPIYVGPGAIPTMKLFKNKNILENLSGFTPNNFPALEFNNKKINLSYENWEGIFCEFRKYTNLKSGNGRKRLYNKDYHE